MELALMLQLCRAGKAGTWTLDKLARGLLTEASTENHAVSKGGPDLGVACDRESTCPSSWRCFCGGSHWVLGGCRRGSQGHAR